MQLHKKTRKRDSPVKISIQKILHFTELSPSQASESNILSSRCPPLLFSGNTGPKTGHTSAPPHPYALSPHPQNTGRYPSYKPFPETQWQPATCRSPSGKRPCIRRYCRSRFRTLRSSPRRYPRQNGLPSSYSHAERFPAGIRTRDSGRRIMRIFPLLQIRAIKNLIPKCE